MASQAVLNGECSSKTTTHPAPTIKIENFYFGTLDDKLKETTQSTKPTADISKPSAATADSTPGLGVLSNFKGTFYGTGFNTIFRPNSGPPTGTTFPKPVTPAPPQAPSENVLELNLTVETLSFSNSLGSVPNRGEGAQSDIFLNGVPYFQSISDVTNLSTGKADGQAVGIHAEPGLWMHVPATKSDPVLAASLVRMGSIPHGTTINAQCLAPTTSIAGPPEIPPADITPFVVGSPTSKFTFKSQTATNDDTPRIPQDLSKFIAAGTITQDILTDPNTVLRNANKGKTITKTVTFTVSTAPTTPELGGGTANIAFLQGTGSGLENANAVQMTATFWIETVQNASTGATSTQIQYSQTVFLNFAGLTWPHVSVATLVPATA